MYLTCFYKLGYLVIFQKRIKLSLAAKFKLNTKEIIADC